VGGISIKKGRWEKGVQAQEKERNRRVKGEGLEFDEKGEGMKENWRT
jgi:hypothetical protein